MKPLRSPACVALNDRMRQGAVVVSHMAFAILAFSVLSGCEQNNFVPPPPPKVDVGLPVQQNVTRYLDATGNTAPIQTVDLVDALGTEHREAGHVYWPASVMRCARDSSVRPCFSSHSLSLVGREKM